MVASFHHLVTESKIRSTLYPKNVICEATVSSMCTVDRREVGGTSATVDQYSYCMPTSNPCTSSKASELTKSEFPDPSNVE